MRSPFVDRQAFVSIGEALLRLDQFLTRSIQQDPAWESTSKYQVMDGLDDEVHNLFDLALGHLKDGKKDEGRRVLCLACVKLKRLLTRNRIKSSSYAMWGLCVNIPRLMIFYNQTDLLRMYLICLRRDPSMPEASADDPMQNMLRCLLDLLDRDKHEQEWSSNGEVRPPPLVLMCLTAASHLRADFLARKRTLEDRSTLEATADYLWSEEDTNEAFVRTLIQSYEHLWVKSKRDNGTRSRTTLALLEDHLSTQWRFDVYLENFVARSEELMTSLRPLRSGDNIEREMFNDCRLRLISYHCARKEWDQARRHIDPEPVQNLDNAKDQWDERYLVELEELLRQVGRDDDADIIRHRIENSSFQQDIHGAERKLGNCVILDFRDTHQT